MNHDFLLVDRELDGEWEPLRFIHDPRNIHLDDDFVHHISDTLKWIPTFNPCRAEPHRGLCMRGVTLIRGEGAGIAEQVFGRWASLLALGPPSLVLTGSFGWPAESEAVPHPEGSYERLAYDRDELVGVLSQLSDWCRQITLRPDRLYLYHGGI